MLSRKSGERIQIGDNIFITVIKVSGKSIKVGIDAPQELRIVRDELIPLMDQADKRVDYLSCGLNFRNANSKAS
ncbi:MAG: carbon storage regulator [Pirellulales bacterium]